MMMMMMMMMMMLFMIGRKLEELWCFPDAASGNQPRMIGVTTLVAGFFLGNDAVIGLDQHAFPDAWPWFLDFHGLR